MVTTKVSYVNGLLFEGKITPGNNIVVDVGSGEVKFMVRPLETQLFADFNSAIHSDFEPQLKAILAKLEGIEGVEIEYKKMKVSISDDKRGDEATFRAIEAALEGENIPKFKTGSWRDIESESISSIPLEVEIKLTAISASIGENPGILVSGALGYTAKAAGHGFDKPFSLGKTEAQIKALLADYEFSEKDFAKNIPCFGKMAAFLHTLSIEKYGASDFAYVSTGTSTFGIASVDGRGLFTTNLAMETTLVQDLIFIAKYQEIEKLFPDLQQRAEFCVKAMAILTSSYICMASGGMSNDAIRDSILEEFQHFLSDGAECLKLNASFEQMLGSIQGEQIVSFAREVEVDPAKLAAYLEAAPYDVEAGAPAELGNDVDDVEPLGFVKVENTGEDPS